MFLSSFGILQGSVAIFVLYCFKGQNVWKYVDSVSNIMNLNWSCISVYLILLEWIVSIPQGFELGVFLVRRNKVTS